jgi:hypothetical protein
MKWDTQATGVDLGIPLEPPYHKGDGCDFCEMDLFAEFYRGQDISSGDILILQPGGQQVLVEKVEALEDFFESISVLTVRIVSLKVECLRETPKFVMKMSTSIASSARGLTVSDPTKIITLKLKP